MKQYSFQAKPFAVGLKAEALRLTIFCLSNHLSNGLRFVLALHVWVLVLSTAPRYHALRTEPWLARTCDGLMDVHDPDLFLILITLEMIPRRSAREFGVDEMRQRSQQVMITYHVTIPTKPLSLSSYLHDFSLLPPQQCFDRHHISA